MITQCPVLAHSSFEYRFVARDYGTHLWHAHSGMQRADGVFGPLVVRQYNKDNVHANKYNFDLPEHVIVLNDWINETSISKFSAHHHNDGDNKPSSILINGKGVLGQMNKSGEIYVTPRAEFRVKSGNRYRFRIVNAGFLYCPLEFSIDGHNLTVIASDGKSLEPLEVESLIIYAGL
jgi:L-ascorbate oxidase